MIFKTISIVGLGLIGGSFAAALKKRGISATILGVDFKDVTDKALASGLIDTAVPPEQLDCAIKEADLVLLATPIEQTLKILPKLGEFLKPGALISDVASTKETIVTEANNRLPKGVYFLGGHPMAGSERGGIENADPLLFENAIYVLVQSDSIPPNILNSFVELLSMIGANPLFLAASEHDEIAAVVSHLPQLLAVTLMTCATTRNIENSIFLNLAAGGFRDMTRIASSSFNIWRDILKTNHNNINEAVDFFVDALQQTKASIASNNAEGLFEMAARSRLAIPKDTRGFIHPLYDLYVVVEDKPGVIAQISTILAKQHINIKDIEVVKVRENDAGTLRLAFASEAERSKAAKMLVDNDFSAQIKD